MPQLEYTLNQQLEKLLGATLIDSHDNWKCLCPFHQEKTPSFYIHKEKLIAHCFGCGIAGSIDVLLSKHCALPASEIRDKLGITLDYTLSRAKSEIQKNASAFTDFPDSWLGPWPRVRKHPYLESRGFREDIYQLLDTRYDKATKRIVFPMRRLGQGKLVGAVGRATDNREPKWYYYWDCRKGQTLYSGPRQKYDDMGPLIVVEGIFDYLKVLQTGRRNAVALLGAQPTAQQIQQLKNFTDTIQLCLDNDQAGEAGMVTLKHALRTSNQVLYTELPSHVKDIGELSDAQAKEVLDNPVTLVNKNWKYVEPLQKEY